MVDPFLFFGLTSKISFAARITAVCSTSSSSNSSKSESSEEDESSNKNNAHGSICKRNDEELGARQRRIHGYEELGRVQYLGGGESVADSCRFLGDAGAPAGRTDAVRRREYLKICRTYPFSPDMSPS
jgi:hypothetical protein